MSRGAVRQESVDGVTGNLVPVAANMGPARRAGILDFTRSEMFQRTFYDGMELVEETAAYLDGPGRAESSILPRRVALAYAGESMRLTTRLMQVASWLLLQKAVREGEITPDQAAQGKYRLAAQEICRGRPLDCAGQLPCELTDLLTRSERLYERVDRLDRALYCGEPMSAACRGAGSPRDQHNRLKAAFGVARAART